MKNKFLILPFLIFLLILFTFFYLLIIERNPSDIPSNLINKKIPEIEATTLLKNKKFISSKEFGNEIILVNFFATWCKPCRQEHVFLNDFFERKIKIIGINYKDNSKKTKKWLEELGNPYSNIIEDKNGKIAIDWGVYGIPETFIVSKNNIITYRHVGPITKNVYKKMNSLIKKVK